MQIRVEVARSRAQPWTQVGMVGQADMLGSMTDTTNGRDVLLFGWQTGVPGVWRSSAGIDQTVGSLRKLETTGVELLSDLSEPYERQVIPEDSGVVWVRWSLIGENPS